MPYKSTIPPIAGIEREELDEWFESLVDAIDRLGPNRVDKLLASLHASVHALGAEETPAVSTHYVNTIPADREAAFDGDRVIEQRIKHMIRWNAMAMVVRANRKNSGIGGHISTYASAATLLEVAFNHFFRGRTPNQPGDLVFFQGHGSPGVYARAFLEGRLSEDQLEHFRRECTPGQGLSSYPHPWLMPDFWQFPTVSMGLSPLTAVCQARMLRYLHARGLADTSGMKVWCFMGDGEMDEPESLAGLGLAARDGLDNLIYVVNCNLQRLDGPVRGNGKIIQELEGRFRGAGWNCIKVIWGSAWDPLLAADKDGILVERMDEAVDGEFQKYSVEGGAYMREHFFGKSPELRAMVDHLSDEDLKNLNRGGHDPLKVYAAYHAAVNHRGSPTVILAKTVKGYGLGEAGEALNITHKQQVLDEDQLRAFRDRFDLPISDEDVRAAAFCRLPEDGPEMQYLRARREKLGGHVPKRIVEAERLEIPPIDRYHTILKGTGDGAASTTMAFARLLGILLKDEKIGRRVVPIVPDEARTFGLEPLFRQCGIYAPGGQKYEPVDADQLIFYREAADGQVLEEGISEAGAMGSFTTAGTAYASVGLEMIPFYTFYSMFGYQRVGDMVWAASDAQAKGFLMGATAGRTTLNGEGLQHQDGHSLLLCSTVPRLVCYDPAYGYEVAVIIEDGLRRMYGDGESVFYYMTLYNESYPQPAMPEGVREGILQGMYRVGSVDGRGELPLRPQLFGSGPILREVQKAQKILADEFGVSSDLWSVTSYSELRREAREVDRWNQLHPNEPPRRSYVQEVLDGIPGPFIAASDFLSAVPDQIVRWVPGPYYTLGTDGFGRSDTRPTLRRHFEIDAAHVVFTTLRSLADMGHFDLHALGDVMQRFDIDPERTNPEGA